MTIPLLVHRRSLTLVPSDGLAEEDFARLKDGRDYLVDLRKPRSLPHHRLLFGLLRKVTQNTPTPISENALLSWVKVRTGHVEALPLGFGRTYDAPASIAFDAMDQDEFNRFFDEAARLICAEVIPGLNKPALLAEVHALLNNSAKAA